MAPSSYGSTSIEGDPVFGGQITVTTTTTADDKFAYAWTKMSCYQDGVLVATGFSNVYPNDGVPYEHVFGLSSPAWLSGAAQGKLQVFVESLDLHRTRSEVTQEFEVAA